VHQVVKKDYQYLQCKLIYLPQVILTPPYRLYRKWPTCCVRTSCYWVLRAFVTLDRHFPTL